MKFEEDSSTKSSRISIQYRNRKKTEWKCNEDQQLKKQIKKLNGRKIMWGQIARKMQQKYSDDAHQFTAKACRERYNHYLKEGVNNHQFTEKELQKLIELTQTYGNQWSIIASKMKNRTEQFVKNTFYGMVKKILRIFYKLVFKQRKGSAEIKGIKSHIISKLLCRNNENDSICEEERQIRIMAKELVFKNLKISKQQILDEQFQTQFLIVLQYMQAQNQQYLEVKRRVNNKFLQKAQKTCKQVLENENNIVAERLNSTLFSNQEQKKRNISSQNQINNSSDLKQLKVGQQKTYFK